MIALGYAIVYGVLRLINFAHGDIMMTGAFAGYYVASEVPEDGLLDRSPVLAMVVILAAVAVSTTIAVLADDGLPPLPGTCAARTPGCRSRADLPRRLGCQHPGVPGIRNGSTR